MSDTFIVNMQQTLWVPTYFSNIDIVQMQCCSIPMILSAVSQVGHPKLPSYYNLTTDYKPPNNTQWSETNTDVQCVLGLIAVSPCALQVPSILLGDQELVLAEVEGHNARSLWNLTQPTRTSDDTFVATQGA